MRSIEIPTKQSPVHNVLLITMSGFFMQFMETANCIPEECHKK